MVLFLSNLIATLDGEGWNLNANGFNLKTLGEEKVEFWKNTIGNSNIKISQQLRGGD
jgi:hypothetical protein